MKFSELEIKNEIKEIIEKIGYTDLTEVQEKAIPEVMTGSDVMVRSQTGSGKTMAFAIPVVDELDLNPEQKDVQVLIVCPTRELAIQVADETRKLTTFIPGTVVGTVYGGSDINRQMSMLKKQKPKIVVGTCGRIMDLQRRRALKLHNINKVVLDEADEMLNMGFKEDIENILKTTPLIKQIMLFSATFPDNIRKIVDEFLKEPVHIEIGVENKSLRNIQQSYMFVKRQSKKDALLKYLQEHNPYLSIVFSNTKKMTEEIAGFLAKNNISARALNGDMKQGERKRVMDSVINGKTAVLIATDVAARGIDIKNVDCVFNYDIPNDVEFFLHRIGRTARAGAEGKAITIVNTADQVAMLKRFEKQTDSNIEKLDMGSELNNYTSQPSNSEQKAPRQRRKPSGDRFSDRNSRKSSYGKKHFKNEDDKPNFGDKRRRFSEEKSEEDNKQYGAKKSRFGSKRQSNFEKDSDSKKPDWKKRTNRSEKTSSDKKSNYGTRLSKFKNSGTEEASSTDRKFEHKERRYEHKSTYSSNRRNSSEKSKFSNKTKPESKKIKAEKISKRFGGYKNI